MGDKSFSLYTNETEFVDEISANTAVESILRFMVNKGIIKAEINDGCMTEMYFSAITGRWFLRKPYYIR